MKHQESNTRLLGLKCKRVPCAVCFVSTDATTTTTSPVIFTCLPISLLIVSLELTGIKYRAQSLSSECTRSTVHQQFCCDHLNAQKSIYAAYVRTYFKTLSLNKAILVAAAVIALFHIGNNNFVGVLSLQKLHDIGQLLAVVRVLDYITFSP